MSFENNLIKLRKQKGWSQDELAENLDLSRQAISKWENGTSKPDIDNIKRISKVFDVGIDELLSNDITDNHALSLDFDSNKKKKKSDKGILLVKCIIFALVIIYVISVIYKLVALLIIVNGVEKYQNLSNYHYIITTYNENGLSQKEECWFKDGELKINNVIYNEENPEEVESVLDFNKQEGYINSSNNNYYTVNMVEYNKIHSTYKSGGQLCDTFPAILRKNSLTINLISCLYFNELSIQLFSNGIIIKTDDYSVNLNKKTLLPESIYYNRDLSLIIYNYVIN